MEENTPRNMEGVVDISDKTTAVGASVNLPKPIPPEHQAILDQKIAENGLAYREFTCQLCGFHISDEAVLLGVLRKKCPKCKFPNVLPINRVGEEELMERMARQRQAEQDKSTGKE